MLLHPPHGLVRQLLEERPINLRGRGVEIVDSRRRAGRRRRASMGIPSARAKVPNAAWKTARTNGFIEIRKRTPMHKQHIGRNPRDLMSQYCIRRKMSKTPAVQDCSRSSLDESLSNL